MNKYDTIKSEFNKYSKKEIIEAIVCSKREYTNADILLIEIRKNRNNNIQKEIDVAYNEYNKASHDFFNYIGQLKNKYEKAVIYIDDLNEEELKKLKDLEMIKNIVAKKLDCLYEKQDKIYEETLRDF